MNGLTFSTVVLALAAMIFAVISFNSAADGTVTVLDGDTLDIAGERVRLFGVDAPETDQPGGQEAKAWLAAEIAKGGGKLRLDRRGPPDKYNRTIAVVYLGNRSLNLALVANGWGWAYVQYATTYVATEARARKAKLGLWAFPCPVPPWQHRNG